MKTNNQAKQLSEHQIQSSFFHELKLHGFQERHILAFSIKNETGKNNIIAGFRNKRSGVLKGMADVIVLDLRETIHYNEFIINAYFNSQNNSPVLKRLPLFLEFKTLKGKQSQSQKNIQEMLEAKGYTYALVRSSEEGIKRVREYFNL